MVKGIEKKELEAKKAELAAEIDSLEIEEKTQSTLVHGATAEKSRLKAEIIYKKSQLKEYDKLINASHEIGGSSHGSNINSK